MKQLKPWFLLASAAIVLAACGGGSDDAPAPVAGPLDAVPASAQQDSNGFVAYLLSLIGALGADTREPVSIPAGFTAPTDDTTETSGV